VTADQEAPAAGRRPRTRLILQDVLSLVLVVAIFYYLFTKIDLAQVWAAITAIADHRGQATGPAGAASGRGWPGRLGRPVDRGAVGRPGSG
jgi:hypothetical protein